MTEAAATTDARPPMGLGNYKGVMLCNRPDAILSQKVGPPPFKSTISETYGQPIGLNAPKSENTETPIKRPKQIVEAVKKHSEWLQKLQQEMIEAKVSTTEAKEAEANKLERVKQHAARQRDGVRKLLKERREQCIAEADVARELHEAVKGKDMTKVPLAQKPLWAMTEVEKDEFDLIEADALIDFAGDLDFDKYIFDLEFRDGLEALKHRSKAIDDEQKLFQEDLVAALNAEETEAASDDEGRGKEDIMEKCNLAKSQWDSSTTVGEKMEEDQETRSKAQQVLQQNSDIRSVHSESSIRKIIARQKEKKVDINADPDNTSSVNEALGTIRENIKVPDPKITLHEKVKLKGKDPDPSQLPYLHRSPAV